MSLPVDLLAQFSLAIRTRGDAYWRAGRVHVLRDAPERFEAEVRGSHRYAVTLARRRDGRVSLDCSCPFVEEHALPCKHLWATVLEADRCGSPLVARGAPAPGAPATRTPPAPASPPDWRLQLRRLVAAGALATDGPPGAPAAVWPAGRRLAYLVDVLGSTFADIALHVELATQAPARGGTWAPPRRFAYGHAQWLAVPDPDDREIAHLLLGAREGHAVAAAGGWYGRAPSVRRFEIPRAAYPVTLRRICATGRAFVRLVGAPGPLPLAWDDGAPWRLVLALEGRDPVAAAPRRAGRRGAAGADAAHATARVRVSGALVRLRAADAADAAPAHDEERLALDLPAALLEGLVVLRPPHAPRRPDRPGAVVVAPADYGGALPLARALRAGQLVEAPAGDAVLVATELAALHPRLPAVELPEVPGVESVRVAPRPLLTLDAASAADAVVGTLAFEYAGTHVAAERPGLVVSEVASEVARAPGPGAAPPRHRLVHRDAAAEAAARERLAAGGARRGVDPADDARLAWRVPRARAPELAAALVGEGWAVTLDGGRVRAARGGALRVRAGIDWFDLEGDVDFDGVVAPLPTLLAALARGARTVALDDGSIGVLPEHWAARLAAVAALAPRAEGAGGGAGGGAARTGVRFARGQALLLDACLAAVQGGDASGATLGAASDAPLGPAPDAALAVDVDAAFARARDAVRAVAGAPPVDAPDGFGATLRPYQRAGLGWLHAVARLGLGGVLADDMGLGKTVQVLALLEARRQAGAGPSLVVVPRSLLFNWVREAERFAPALRVHVHHGPARAAHADALAGAHVVLTTYGTLRQDAAALRAVDFDYAVLDEAQAIKNAATGTARATRLVRARHRLAMTGTPIENRLDDLWSLFEFLNPGLLGAAPRFRELVRAGREGSEAGRALVARGVRPLLLRRTKAQVAPELPARTEQTRWVELGAAERRLYDELRDHYRAALLARVARDGVPRARMHVLEALLRLRQAACHPGLVDPARAADGSSKLEVLAGLLGEVVAEGHKAVVFSQFTTLLGFVRARLARDGIAHEYLDGRTRDRERRVTRFQDDPDCPVFLVSLKAGGVGLNLTAADHVVLLDPWWNPAVEAQAIDRAHRIGQQRPVLAQRLVARDTVEEKVLALQHEKRALADAIVRADAPGIARLTVEELQALLG